MPDSPAFYEERIRLLQAENQEAQEMLAIEQRNGNDLLAENQRLRDALEQIIEVPVGPWRDFFTAGITIARKALSHHD